MDLQLSRNIEQFIELLSLPPCRVEEVLVFEHPPFGLRIEAHGERLMLTSWSLTDKGQRTSDAIQLNSPERFFGIPQRVFTISDQLMISALCPRDYDAHQWLRLCQRQRQFLTNLNGGC